jgi:hypothetical protein
MDSLYKVLQDYFDWNLAGNYEAQEAIDAAELASTLENSGYCASPYLEYENALMCPINKNREAYCGCTQCKSYNFCMRLRKEGYV